MFVSVSNLYLNRFILVGRSLIYLQEVLSSWILFFEYRSYICHFTSFGNLFCFIRSLMQFSRSLQICLFASFTILVGITPLVFLVGSSEFMILEMSSLFTNLKSNNCVVSIYETVLIMLGCFLYF